MSSRSHFFLLPFLVGFGVLMLVVPSATAQEDRTGAATDSSTGGGAQAENASNPLAKVANTDLRWQYLALDSAAGVHDLSVDGSFMASDQLKIRYELHYWETNVTGSSHNGWESLVIKPIYFPTEGAWGNVKYRVAVGMDWILDLGDQDQGIGSGSDQLGPFAGVALGLEGGTTIIPLVQQFFSYNGENVNTTAFRVIALKPLPNQQWLKLDAKIPYDWENETFPITSEVQFGKNFTENFALYVDGLVGIGGDRPFEWGSGIGIRFNYCSAS